MLMLSLAITRGYGGSSHPGCDAKNPWPSAGQLGCVNVTYSALSLILRIAASRRPVCPKQRELRLSIPRLGCAKATNIKFFGHKLGPYSGQRFSAANSPNEKRPSNVTLVLAFKKFPYERLSLRFRNTFRLF
jgi:hypothetical protein